MSPVLHAQALADARTALAAGDHVLVIAAPGVGKTRFISALARSTTATATVRLSVASGQPQSLLVGLLPADARENAAQPESLAEALAQALCGRVLLIDDAHRLSADDEAALDALIRRPEPGLQVVATMSAFPHRGLRLQRLRRDDLMTAVDLLPLSEQQAADFAQSVIAPERWDRETLRRILAQCGGVPLLLHEYSRALRLGHALVSSGGIVMWDETPVRRADTAELADALLLELSSDARRAVSIAALAGPISTSVLTSMTDPDAVDEAQTTGLLRPFGDVTRGRSVIGPPFAAEAIRSSMPHAARVALGSEILATLPLDAQPASAWTAEELIALVSLGDAIGQEVPLPVTRAAWEAGRGGEDQNLVNTLAHALATHPDADPAERIGAYTARLRNGMIRSVPSALRSEIPTANALLTTVPALVRAEYLGVRAHYELGLDQDLERGLTTIDEELAALAGRGDADSNAARATLQVHRANLLTFAGRMREAYVDLCAMLAGPRQTHNLPLVSTYVMLAAQRGDIPEAIKTATRYFTLSLTKVSTYSWVPAEIVRAGFFLDILSGRRAAALRTMKRLSAALFRKRDTLPPYDAASGQAGAALLHASSGAWLEAISEYDAAVTRRTDRDHDGSRRFALASYAIALAAVGDVGRAEGAILEARELWEGAIRVGTPFTEVQLLMAELWLGRDVRTATRELAADAADDGLRLIELRAWHMHALASGPHTAPQVVARASELADTIDAPIARPLADHIRDLAAGLPRLTTSAARELARCGMIVPHRVSPGVLTTREAQVAAAAALGYSAKAIADQLGNSKRTIDAHLNRIYVKLNVNGRDELAAALDAQS